MKFSRQFFIIFVIQVTEVLGFSLILPFLPLYAEKLGASPLLIGSILTAFSLCQFISAPIMGRLSDQYGRKPLLIFSQLSTFLSFIILGVADSIWMIFLSRIIDGILGSNFTIAQAYISDISSEEDRSKAFGKSSAAFGFGFLVGPALGGFLAQFGYSVPAFLAAFVSFLTIIITVVFLPETVEKKGKFKLNSNIFHIREFKAYFSNPKISPRLWEFFTYLLSHSIFVSTFALFAQKQLGLTTGQIGFVLAYIGLNSIIIRTVLLSKIIDLVGEKVLRNIGVIFIIISMIFVAIINQLWQFLIVITFYSFGSGVSRPVLIGSISRKVSSEKQGSIMGVTSSLGSVSRIIGPLVGGFMIENFFPGSLGIAAAVVMAIGLLIIKLN